MVTIRLTRRGARNQPFYHVVVTDSRKRQGGASLEQVGYFNPIARRGEPKLKLDLPRIDYWLGKGAQQSDRVKQLVTTYRKQAAAWAHRQPVRCARLGACGVVHGSTRTASGVFPVARARSFR
jgi:small subunit ribosomal protein S16